MTTRERWTVIDRRTGKEVTAAVFSSRKQAEDHITEWRDRHDRGGRPDITWDKLENLEPKELT